MTTVKNRFTGATIIEVETLTGAYLTGAYLTCADLSGADLSGADLSGANLSGANLRRADLSDADLSDADLSNADLDYSCLSFSCKSRMAKTDRRQRVQLAHHLLSWVKYADSLDNDEMQIFDAVKVYANEFHRTDVEKFD